MQRNGSTYLVLQDIRGNDGSPHGNGTRHLRVREMLGRAERVLRENGASYRDVVRTWFQLVPAQAYVGQFLMSFKEYPQRQKAASFNLDEVMEKMKESQK